MTRTTDIIERLEEHAGYYEPPFELLVEAAAEIKELRRKETYLCRAVELLQSGLPTTNGRKL